MNKHKIVHVLNVLIILLLLMLLFYRRTGWFDELPPAPQAPASVERAAPLRLPEYEAQVWAPRLYPREKMIEFPPSEVTLPWRFTLPDSSAQKRPIAAPLEEGRQLNLEEQKALFYELSFTEYKAASDGFQRDPSFGETYRRYVYKWNSIYREATREKYGVNKKQLEEIYEKGIAERWRIFR